jgi:hypothetical protein
MNHPLLLLLVTGAGIYLLKLWRDDLRAALRGAPTPNAFPGAFPATPSVTILSLVGALVILAVESIGEVALGVAGEQARLSWLFALYSVAAAPVIEETIFRGWLVVENRGRATMWAAAALASLVFALLHPFLWRWEDAGFELTLGRKGWFSAAMVFALSFWFYLIRLGPWNKTRSLLPCFAGHAAKNLGVIAIKAATGFMGGLW